MPLHVVLLVLKSVSTTYDSGSPNCIPKTVKSSQSCSAPLCSTCTVPSTTKKPVLGSCSATTCGTVGSESVSTTYDSGPPNCIPKTVNSSQSCQAPSCNYCTSNLTPPVWGSCSATTCDSVGTVIRTTNFDSGSPNCIPISEVTHNLLCYANPCCTSGGTPVYSTPCTSDNAGQSITGTETYTSGATNCIPRTVPVSMTCPPVENVNNCTFDNLEKNNNCVPYLKGQLFDACESTHNFYPINNDINQLQVEATCNGVPYTFSGPCTPTYIPPSGNDGSRLAYDMSFDGTKLVCST